MLTSKIDSIARNASCSPLLRIPLEIRNKIWTLLLGDRLIHLDYLDLDSASASEDKSLRSWSDFVCPCDRPENERPQEDVDWQYSHPRCESQLTYGHGFEPHPKSYESMHLTVLRACRQTYNETNHVLWSTNTFSFADDGTTFRRFMDTRTTYQKRSLRKLRLDMHWEGGDEKLWNRALGMACIRSLVGLRGLRQLGLYKARYLEFAQRVKILPLTDVEIFIADYADRVTLDPLWTAGDRAEYAEGIREMLLDPKGAEVYAREQEEMKEFHRQDRDMKGYRLGTRNGDAQARFDALLKLYN